MLTKESLLARILDNATIDAKRAIAVRALKPLTGKDRGDLAAKYARSGAAQDRSEAGTAAED
jgi:hypothetical protein